jgi:hypothetical protein
MPKGLKDTSSTVGIGFSLAESGANTFTQSSVDLNLDPLNNEVFVVQAINLDPTSPDMITGVPTQTHMSLTTTSATAVQNLSNSNCLATSVLNIETDAVNAVPFMRDSQDTPAAMLEYIGIIATNDFFIQIKGTGNTNPTFGSGRLFGYRARADASIYAALVQSEVLSA